MAMFSDSKRSLSSNEVLLAYHSSIFLNQMDRHVEAHETATYETVEVSNGNHTETQYATSSHTDDTGSTNSSIVLHDGLSSHRHSQVYSITPSSGYNQFDSEDLFETGNFPNPAIYPENISYDSHVFFPDSGTGHFDSGLSYDRNIWPDLYIPEAPATTDIQMASNGHNNLSYQAKSVSNKHTSDSDASRTTNYSVRYQCRSGCDQAFTRAADLKRHEETIHALHGKVVYYCGCCDNKKQNKSFNRTDKLLEHKRKIHGCGKERKWQSLSECQHADCRQDIGKTMFCSEAALDQHLREAHPASSPELLTTERKIPQPSNSNGLFNEDALRVGRPEPTASRKRAGIHESNEIVKRTKREELLPSHSQPLAGETSLVLGSGLSAQLPQSCPAAGHAHGDLSNCTIVEEQIPNVRISEFYSLSRLKENGGQSIGITSALMYRFEKLQMTFNIPQRLLKIRGCKTDTNELKLKLEVFLKDYQMPKVSLDDCHSSSVVSCYGKKVLGDLGIRRQQKTKIFAMNHRNDSALLDVWHDKIMPSLPAMLKKAIGLNFSVTLVRRGRSAEESRAVILIQCQRRPNIKIQKNIRSRIMNHIDETLSNYRTKIEFSTEPLLLLAGDSHGALTDDSDDTDSEEDYAEYPHNSRYWSNPGIGASIGFACSDSVSATLGCYLHVESRLYILTVKHLMTKAHKALTRGEPTTDIMCPPPLEVEALEQDLDQHIREIELEMEKGAQDLGLSEVGLDNSQLGTCWGDLYKQIRTAQEHLNQIRGNPNNLLLGQVKYYSQYPTSHREQFSRPVTPVEPEHHMDWALCDVVKKREGVNRHRFPYNYTTKEVEFDKDTKKSEGYGAGPLISETGPVVANAMVHYVGSTGRQQGQINGAKALVNYEGRSTFEWTMIIDADSQRNRKYYRGDSGASVIQNNDNKMIGQVFASAGRGALVIAPIEVVIQDIKETLQIGYVSLQPPPAEQGAAAIMAEPICRLNKRKPRRFPIKGLPIKTPKQQLEMVPVSSKVKLQFYMAKYLTQTDAPDYKHSIEFLLALPPGKLVKHLTFPAPWKQSIPSEFSLRRSGSTWPMMPREVKDMGVVSVS